MWQIATAFNLGCVIVLLSRLFSRRRALKLRSAVQDVVGETSSIVSTAPLAGTKLVPRHHLFKVRRVA